MVLLDRSMIAELRCFQTEVSGSIKEAGSDLFDDMGNETTSSLLEGSSLHITSK